MQFRYVVFSLFVLSTLCQPLQGQTPPKREFRAAWVATVANLDWPSSPTTTPDVQKAQLISMLDQLKANGINAIIFQVRPECDALYQSSLEPWSYYLTGNQGTPPSPFYDPLAFAIDEAHKRGMELHAWFNPYRAVRSVGLFTPAPTHVSVVHPDWILPFGTLKVLDPGLPAVRQFVTGVIIDVVRRYDVDGIHFDDYFYPYEGITTQDAATFAANNPGQLSLPDWRRDNVNKLVAAIHDSIQAIKPFVKFGISPFGIWKSGVPGGIVGMSSYSDIYCDPVTWMQHGWLDYLTPQLYWPFGAGQDYGKLLPWWATQVNGHHLYPGQAAYRIVNWSPAEVPNQILLNRATPNVYGSVFFRALVGVNDNPKGFADSLRNNYYRYLSLLPVMSWKDATPPYLPRAIRYAPLASPARPALQWDLPLVAPDGDTASRYAVYRFDHVPALPGELADVSALLSVEGQRSSSPLASGSGPYHYVVTALDRNWNEGEPSNVLTVSAPDAPLLALPANGTSVPESVKVVWRVSPLAAMYHLQVSSDSAFKSGLLVNDSSIVDTFKVVRALAGQTTYYWRLAGRGAGGKGSFSTANSFVTGTPVLASLLYPANLQTNVPLATAFSWMKAGAATAYRFQVATTSDFAHPVVDSTGIADTTLSVSGLSSYTIYFWHVKSLNGIGASDWTNYFRFRTLQVVSVAGEEPSGLPSQYSLEQNYPNPFNPLTTIRFALPSAEKVTLKVYDLLGKEVAVLVDGDMAAGFHTVNWDGARHSSGVYFYRIVAGSYVASRRMVLIR